MFETMPVSITAFFVADECEATLRITADSTRYVDISIIHDSGYRDGSLCHLCNVYDFPGDGASEKVQVQDRDVLIVLAKKSDELIATETFQVDLAMVESIGKLLMPKGGYNLLVDQESVSLDEMSTLPVLSIHGLTEVAS